MRLFEFFDKTYIINLPNRTDRRDQCLKELSAVGVAPDLSRIEFFPAIRPLHADGFPSIGTHGSLRSHLEALRRARQEGLKRVLLVEDDVAFSPRLLDEGFGPAMEAFLSADDWDFLYIGHNLISNDPDQKIVINEHTGHVMLSHCLGFHERIFDELIKYLEGVLTRPAGHPEGGKVGFDPSMIMFRQRVANRTFVLQPCLAHQRPSRTDLGQHPWFDSVPILRESAQLTRKLRAAWDRQNRFRH